jgi:hypothetical protein
MSTPTHLAESLKAPSFSVEECTTVAEGIFRRLSTAGLRLHFAVV